MSRTGTRITTRNARFQQWQALLDNRNKRQRGGEFLVQGVRPITLAIQYGWQIRALIYDADRSLSRWASGILDSAEAPTRVAMASELLGELGEKADSAPELVAVVGLPPDDLDRIAARADMLVLGFDRPTSPGNIGTLVRSADAFGAAGLIITGHAADVYDPKAVRASTGSLFALPTVRVPGPQPVLAWVDRMRQRGIDLRIVGTDEQGDSEIGDLDLTGPTMLLIGNETTGLSAAWREAVDSMATIPMTGAASSLNAAAAASIVLYEASRQRRAD